MTSPSRVSAGWSVMLARRWPLPGSRQAGHGQLARSQEAETPARSQEAERVAGSQEAEKPAGSADGCTVGTTSA